MRCLAGGGSSPGGHTGAGSPTYQGAAVRPLEIPLDGPVVQADPLVFPVLVWGGRGVLGGAQLGPPAPPVRRGLKGTRG